MERRPSPVLAKLGSGIRDLLDSPEAADLPTEMRKLLVQLDNMLSTDEPSQLSGEGRPESDQN